MSKGYDIIGDVHGRFDAMMELTGDLGYSVQSDGSLEHESGERELIFVGDLVNKGYQNKAVIDTVRASVDAGTADAVLGNHEFFNTCYSRVDNCGYFLVEHSDKADRFLKTFLDEFPVGTQANAEAIDWLSARPIFVQRNDLTVAHAMHNQEDLWRVHSEMHDDHSLKAGAFERHAASVAAHAGGQRVDTRFFWAVERLLYGVSIRAHDDLREQGYNKRIRLKWWEGQDASPVRLLGLEQAHLDKDLIEDISKRLRGVKHHESHSFEAPEGLMAFGHYSLKQEPALVSDKALCVDFKGADERGLLTAYRFDEGDTAFDADKFVSVDAPFVDDSGCDI